MENNQNKMKRGVQQALYRYLPGKWADFYPGGGGDRYAVKVERWNSVQLPGVNSKRLLRIVNQKVKEFRDSSPLGPIRATANFSEEINEDNYYVLTPKSGGEERAIVTSVNPLLFVCTSCGHVRQFATYKDFKANAEKAFCPSCKSGHMQQLAHIRVCKCGYAAGIFVHKCPQHGTSAIVRRGNGLDFYCTKCNQRMPLDYTCSSCKGSLKYKRTNDSSAYFPFNLTVIDLLHKDKDAFLEKEENSRGELAVLAQYIGTISQEEYDSAVKQGCISSPDEFEEALAKEAEIYRRANFDESVIEAILDAKRRADPSQHIVQAIEEVRQEISGAYGDRFKRMAEEILEYDELVHANTTFSLEEAERDAEIVNDGLRPDYVGISRRYGFSNVQVSSGVPIIFAAYGFTREVREPQDGAVLNGFPQEMNGKKNIYASRLETEGVLFELDRGRILDWLVENNFMDAMQLPPSRSDEEVKLWFLEHIQLEQITSFSPIDETSENGVITKAIYTLVHSISHALMIEASELCGLDKSSLSEYILPSVPAVFIYCSNSQGFKMGALHHAFQTHFDKWMKRARERSQKCLFDPVCIDNEKACVGCLFLNEISCQHFNKDLDRSYLCGYYDTQSQKRLHGFWED